MDAMRPASCIDVSEQSDRWGPTLRTVELKPAGLFGDAVRDLSNHFKSSSQKCEPNSGVRKLRIHIDTCY